MMNLNASHKIKVLGMLLSNLSLCYTSSEHGGQLCLNFAISWFTLEAGDSRPPEARHLGGAHHCPRKRLGGGRGGGGHLAQPQPGRGGGGGRGGD